MAFTNQAGPAGTLAAMQATNPDRPSAVPLHDHPDLHNRLSVIENIIADAADLPDDDDGEQAEVWAEGSDLS